MANGKKTALRAALAAVAGVAVVALLLGLLAPQVFVLAREGFPGPVWPARGSFAPVTGAPRPDGERPRARLPAAAATRFADSGGRALIVDQGGKVTVEAYGPGIDRDTRLNSYSMVKSLVGALALRAVAEGRIAGLDVALPDILGPTAPDITLSEALTMTSGLALAGEPPKPEAGLPLDDGDFSPFAPVARLHAFGIAAILPRLRVDAGQRGSFHSQSVNTALVGMVVERAWGRPLQDILSELIWAPAGAADAEWRTYPAGTGVSAYCCLYARPVDWVLVARFLMKNGTEADPFLPGDLWQAFLLPDLEPDLRRAGAYGYQVRHDVLDRPGATPQGRFAYFMGHGGQVVYLLPETDTVVVRFGARAQLLHSTLYELPGDPGPLP